MAMSFGLREIDALAFPGQATKRLPFSPPCSMHGESFKDHFALARGDFAPGFDARKKPFRLQGALGEAIVEKCAQIQFTPGGLVNRQRP